MARRATHKHTPKRTSQPKLASLPWLPFQHAFEQLCERAGSSEQAKAAFETILHSGVPSLEQKVSFNGEKIRRVRHADFWENSAYLWVETDVSSADRLRVHYTEYDPSLPAEPGDFHIRAADFKRELERLYPVAVTPPLEPSKEPTPKKKRRKAKSVPAKARRRGPKAEILPRLTVAMKDDITNQKLSLDELEAMSDKELVRKYSAKRERVRAARQLVVDESKK